MPLPYTIPITAWVDAPPIVSPRRRGEGADHITSSEPSIEETMETLSLRAFDALYQDVVTDVLRLWTPAMQEELIVHCRGWGSGGFDLERIHEEAR